MTTWISADHHFGHENIIKYTYRPYKDSREMDDELISNWNSYVAPGEPVWYLGDFTLGDKELADYYFSRINGAINVLGNPWHHDKRWLDKINIPGATSFSSRCSHGVYISWPMTVLEGVTVDEDGNDIPAVLCHYALEIWDRKHYRSLHFHAHSHGMLPPMHNRLDVGVDNAYKLLGEYRPFSLEEAIDFAIAN